MLKPQTRSSQSFIGTLSLYDAQVTPQTLAREVVLRFQEEPDLPGVLLVHGKEPIGVVSRQRFFEQGCLMAGALGWDQPIEALMMPYANPPLIVSDRTPILTVVEQIRQRLSRAAFDPIGVTFRDGSLRLVDARRHILNGVLKTLLVTGSIELMVQLGVNRPFLRRWYKLWLPRER